MAERQGAILDAKTNPISWPPDTAKLARRPRVLKAAIGPVTVPAREDTTEDPSKCRKR